MPSFISRFQRHPGLRSLVTLMALVLSVGAGSVLAALRCAQLDEEVEVAAGLLQLQQATAAAAAVEADLARIGRELLAQARLVERLDLLEHRARLRVLLDGAFAAPGFAWACITDGRGRVLAALDDQWVGADVSQHAWWPAGRHGLHYGEQVVARQLPQPHAGEPWHLVNIAAPLRDGVQGGTGVLAVHLSWPWLRERVALYADTHTGAARAAQWFIAGHDGHQRVGPAGEAGTPLPVQPLAAREPRGWRVLAWPDGQAYVTAWARHPGDPGRTGLGWTTVVRTPLAALHEAGAPARRAVWGTAALVVAGSTALAWLLSTLLLAPLGRYVARVRGMAEDTQALPSPPRLLPAEFAQLHTVLLAQKTAHARAQRASEAKDRFLATMSHELRTPLNGLLGHAQLLQARLKDEDNRANAERILSTGSQLLHILNEVLDLARIESGPRALELEHQPLRLEAVLQGCHELFAPTAEAKGLRLVLALPVVPLPWVMGDAARLQQVLSNLMANALKFTEHGSVTLALVPEGLADDGRLALRIEVEDTGMGMTEAQRLRLFEPFQQAEASTARRFGGTGLGLWISRRLVQAMGGEITVQSEPGRGTRVQLRLALERTPAGSEVPAGAPPAPGGAVPAQPARALRVLVVDDVAINREVLRALVQHQGHAVEECADAVHAVQRVAAGDIDLVLMDVEMPGVDGLEATRRLRALPGAAGRVPVWAVTGRAYEHDVAQVRAAGMDGHLSKPVSFAALDELLRAVAAQPPSQHAR